MASRRVTVEVRVGNKSLVLDVCEHASKWNKITLSEEVALAAQTACLAMLNDDERKERAAEALRTAIAG